MHQTTYPVNGSDTSTLKCLGDVDLISLRPTLQFPVEIESNNALPFSDILVMKRDRKLATKVSGTYSYKSVSAFQVQPPASHGKLLRICYSVAVNFVPGSVLGHRRTTLLTVCASSRELFFPCWSLLTGKNM
jgi:hypothetical protein